MFTDYYTVTCACIGLFLYLDGLRVVKNSLIKFNKLNRLVAMEHTGVINIFFISMFVVFNVLFKRDRNTTLQRCECVTETLECGNYLVTYYIEQTVYKMFVKKKKGPKKVLLIHDEEQTDVSDMIFPYLGPCDNFHSIKYTPNFFNKKELVFEFSNGDERVFKHMDEICL